MKNNSNLFEKMPHLFCLYLIRSGKIGNVYSCVLHVPWAAVVVSRVERPDQVEWRHMTSHETCPWQYNVRWTAICQISLDYNLKVTFSVYSTEWELAFLVNSKVSKMMDYFYCQQKKRKKGDSFTQTRNSELL